MVIEKIEGKLAEICTRNYMSGETEFLFSPIYKHKLQNKNGLIKCIGRIRPYSENTPLVITGSVQKNLFLVSDCHVSSENKESIKRYLHFASSELTDSQMERITDAILASEKDLFTFLQGKDAKSVLLDALKTSSRREKLVNALVKKTENIAGCEDFFSTLSKYDIPYDKIWQMAIKGITLDMLSEHPYSYMSTYDVPLEAVDRFAREELGFTVYSVQRYEGFTRSAIKNTLAQGDTCIEFNALIKKINFLFKSMAKKDKESSCVSMTPVLLNFCLSKMRSWCFVAREYDKNYVYINHVYDEEATSLLHLKRLALTKKETDFKIDINEVQKKLGITYNKEQTNAFKLLNTTGIKILTGPPGSGKTALVRGIIDVFKQNDLGVIKLSATTGMAADVLTKSAGIDDADNAATTVHVMMKVTPFEEEGMLNAAIKEVNAKLIIVDEISMIGLNLFTVLVSAIKNNAILLLVGDEHQLQSVDYGNVLGDLIKSRMIETYRLKTVIRSNNVIAHNAEHILNGEIDKIIQNNLFNIENCETEEEVLRKVLRLSKNDNMILSPIKKSILGVEKLNSVLQKKNIDTEHAPYMSYGDTKFFIGDKVVMTKNNYQKGYINGEGGIIKKIFDNGILIDFNSSLIMIERSDIGDMSLAYAETVHKSQGSEYDTVVIVLPKNSGGIATRRLLYTAVTRAKNKVYILSLNGSFTDAVNNTKEQKRTTMFPKKICDALSKA